VLTFGEVTGKSIRPNSGTVLTGRLYIGYATSQSPWSRYDRHLWV